MVKYSKFNTVFEVSKSKNNYCIVFCRLLILILFILSLLSVVFLDEQIFRVINLLLYSNSFDLPKFKDKVFFYDVITSEFTLLLVSGLFIIYSFVIMFSHLVIKSLKVIVMFVFYQLICLGVLNYIKMLLKYVFARCVPEVCMLNKTHYLLQYGFSWFDNGFASFPSGHCMVLSYAVIWSFYYRNNVRTYLSILFSMMFVSLILLNYHFLGDCISGTAIGILIGYLSIIGWEFLLYFSRNFKNHKIY